MTRYKRTRTKRGRYKANNKKTKFILNIFLLKFL